MVASFFLSLLNAKTISSSRPSSSESCTGGKITRRQQVSAGFERYLSSSVMFGGRDESGVCSPHQPPSASRWPQHQPVSSHCSPRCRSLQSWHRRRRRRRRALSRPAAQLRRPIPTPVITYNISILGYRSRFADASAGDLWHNSDIFFLVVVLCHLAFIAALAHRWISVVLTRVQKQCLTIV